CAVSGADRRQTRPRAAATLDQDAPIASVAELPNYDAIIFGTPTRARDNLTPYSGKKNVLDNSLTARTMPLQAIMARRSY
ncbi:MAG TPA: hypothetical protein VN494_01055, partial [Patescibacteria group bacterium]|nr:hypothetical protein [Patescibacteria group bacterium]